MPIPKLTRLTMMIYVEKCCSQKGRLLVTSGILQHGKAFHPSWRDLSSLTPAHSLLFVVLRALEHLLSVLATVLVERSFIDLLLYTMSQRPSSEHNRLSQMALLVLNHSVPRKKPQTLSYSWLTTQNHPVPTASEAPLLCL